MIIQENISLKNYNTFGIDAKAQSYVDIRTISDLQTVLKSESSNPFFVLGGGSNMLLTKDIEALVIHLNLKGISIFDKTNDYAIIEAKAGENWHDFVLWCLDKNLGGIENMSLIPGNIGTAPIQNIGAYGVELKDVFHSCEAINISTQEIKTFTTEDCNFGYRESVFKQNLKGQYIITSVKLKLSKGNHRLNIDYGAIKSELEKLKITKPSIKDISRAVISIRQSKLPDPKEIGNSGSFFKNPVISKEEFKQLQNNFPQVPHYVISEKQIKVPAGWLIETAGFKGKRFGDYGVHNKQALVLVNYGNALGKDIYDLAKLIQQTVFRLFSIKIETEVNII
ncbi:UDP-N-acetylenolpyruvoylglucosamine reductase [Winogradskyella sp. PC-19]|uniref:UDP-N-acetylmuramate dehydrogenase n=1 Tax=unclassified Winogradskyella TaxID=2615021 RepID=UPI000B3CB557|nr:MULTISPECIES: UDP-N-acetylmuramate dehydrogenase [unclassified Winogradskyella]ARV10292.1 UDP-N-acetylenolpyruvoylglucosamine reductase [Winogradskyella sp. PC-19]RZN75440.1 MAG: UDP-N-acetylmuramate dehydrogenase [Winogradskyella sp.]